MRTMKLPKTYGQENTGFMKIKRRRKPIGFNPDSAYISQAITEYLSRGGAINIVEANRASFNYSITVNDPVCVDEFLLGN